MEKSKGLKYREHLAEYYQELQLLAEIDVSTSRRLREYQGMLERCQLLPSPAREIALINELTGDAEQDSDEATIQREIQNII